MKTRILMCLAILAGVLVINSCEKNDPKLFVVSVSNCDTNHLTYNGGMDTIINTNCGTSNNSCHSPTGVSRFDYTTYAKLLPQATGGKSSKMWQYLFVLKTMPLAPQPPLDACTSAKFQAWLNDGAPQ